MTDLTERERQILALVMEGMPNKLIARQLNITESVVATHLTDMYEKTGTRNRTQLAVWAVRKEKHDNP